MLYWVIGAVVVIIIIAVAAQSGKGETGSVVDEEIDRLARLFLENAHSSGGVPEDVKSKILASPARVSSQIADRVLELAQADLDNGPGTPTEQVQRFLKVATSALLFSATLAIGKLDGSDASDINIDDMNANMEKAEAWSNLGQIIKLAVESVVS